MQNAIQRRSYCVSHEILDTENLIVFPNFFLDPNDLPFICLADVLVLDLHGIHGLGKVCIFPADVDSVSHFEFAISEFNSEKGIKSAVGFLFDNHKLLHLSSVLCLDRCAYGQ